MQRFARTRLVTYFDRYLGRVEEEPIYGENWLRWAYGTHLGRLTVWTLARRKLFSRLYGWMMDRPSSARRIRPFMERFGLNEEEFSQPVRSFRTFNEFFSRKLKAEARPIDPSVEAVAFPADGRHLGWDRFSANRGIHIKGESFTLEELLGSALLADQYADGALVISRLCPTDYHRFHFPVSGVPGSPQRLRGRLDSVSPIALRRRIRILSRNSRVLTPIRTAGFGTVIMVEIGATCVGSIEQSFRPGEPVEKGAEKGLFRFGGSCVVTLFPSGVCSLAHDLRVQTERHRELYARMGDRMGVRSPENAGGDGAEARGGRDGGR